MRRLIAVVAIALALGASVASAQNRSAERAATAVAQSFFNAMSDGRWEDAARLMDLKAFDTYRQSAVTAARQPKREFVLTVEELMRHDPKMPRAVVEYYVQQANEMREKDRFDYISYDFAGVLNADSLAALSPLAAAARWLQAKDPGWQMQHSRYGSSTCKPLLAAHLPRARMTLLATAVTDSVAYDPDYVFPGDSAVHPRRPDVDFLNVLVLRGQNSKWRAEPSEVLFVHGGVSVDCAIMDSDSTAIRKPAK